jgi:DNA (cytosine-5)-methyltransferase 1
MFGNPACAGFSMANSSRGLDSPKNEGLRYANAIGQAARPRAFVVESVPQLLTDGLPLVEQWEREWQGLGYRTCRLQEDASHLGLPQVRKRVLFVAARANLDFELPHRPRTTVWDAISDLRLHEPDASGQNLPRPYAAPALTDFQRRARDGSAQVTWHCHRRPAPRMRELVKYLEPGKRMRRLPDDLYEELYWRDDAERERRGKPGFLVARLRWDAPAPVLTGNATYFHPSEDRYLTVREQARIMGLPDTFTFSRFGQAYAEIGKAVSPFVGEWLGGELARALRDPEGRAHRDAVDLR